MTVPFKLSSDGYHPETRRRYTGRVAELVRLDSQLGESYRRSFLGIPQFPVIPAAKHRRTLKEAVACAHLGPSLEPEKPGCQGCDKRLCKKRGVTTLLYCVKDCTACTQPEPKKLREVKPRTARPSLKFDTNSLAPESGGQRLNSSIIDYEDGYLYAYRYSWNAATTCVIRMNETFQPVGYPVHLGLNHWEAAAGREDARLFRFNSKYHVSFTGWLGHGSPRWNKANMLYARLDRNLETEAIFYPIIPDRNSWEKNHVYFEWQRKLFNVYSIAPHRVLEIDGNNVVNDYRTETKHHWEYGHLRGGASPVRVRNHFYHFFHGMLERESGRLYSLGCAVFEAKPPFKIVRITNEPLDIGDSKTNPGINSDVIFPGGAVFVRGQWVIAMGVHDSYSELRFYSEDYVESMLSPAR